MKLPKKRDYPKEVLVRGNTWSVKFVRKFSYCEDDEHILGECDPSEKIIRIRQGISPLQTWTTFIHELLHAFEEEYEFEVDHDHIEKFEVAIVEFMLSNM